MAQITNTISKITFLQWLKHPTTVLLIFMTLVAWGVTWIYVQSQLEQVTYLRKRIEILEQRESEREKERNEEIDAYVKTLMLKEAQIKGQTVLIDSLKKNIQ